MVVGRDEGEWVEFEDAKCVAATGAAIQVRLDDGELYWFPKSQVSNDSEVWKLGTKGTLIVSEWIAKQKGLV